MAFQIWPGKPVAHARVVLCAVHTLFVRLVQIDASSAQMIDHVGPWAGLQITYDVITPIND